jgi:hypothetical protein
MSAFAASVSPMAGIHDIDVDFSFFDDTPPGKDPDSHSPTLRRYHQLLWSKPLPDGRPFELQASTSRSPYLVYDADGVRIRLGSDTIATRHRKALLPLYSQLSNEVNDAFLRRSYTICGFTLFPVARESINQNRGTHPRVKDRWDLTLECIRRYYQGGVSPLTPTIERFASFFDLFGSFEGYVDHFLLQDFVDESGMVHFLLPLNDFGPKPLPTDLETYVNYRNDNLALFEARRRRILEYIEAR